MRNRWSALVAIDSRLRLSHKLLISYILVVLIPAVCIGYLSYKRSSSTIEEQTSRAYGEALRQTAVNITYRLKEIENISELLYTNEELQKILRRAASGQATKEQILDDFKSIQTTINNLKKSRNIYRIRLFVAGDPLYAQERQSLFPLTSLDGDPIVNELPQQRFQMKWRNTYENAYLDTGNHKVITLFRSIMDFENLRSPLGIAAIDMDERIFQEVFQDMSWTDENMLFVYQNTDLIASYPNPSIHMPQTDFGQYASQLQKLGTNDTGVVRVGEIEYLTVLRSVKDMGWTIALLTPMKTITGSSESIRFFTFLLVATFTFLAIVLSFILSRRITGRIRTLSDSMRRIEQGHYDTSVDVQGYDEISLLQRRFNKMSVEIKSLIEEVYTTQISKQEAELKVLGGQINSHFLYNTLDTIKWMAFKWNASDIVKVVDALSKFFRFGLNRGKDIITVENELMHVQTYIDIQNVRFKNLINCHIQVDPELYNCEMIKLVLQPLIENSIVHGIHNKSDKKGTILIQGSCDETSIRFRVIDDGVGMRAQQAEGLLSREGQSYGLRNVNQRIQLYYGAEYGLSVWSRLGIGTCVTVVLGRKVVHERNEGGVEQTE